MMQPHGTAAEIANKKTTFGSMMRYFERLIFL